MSVVWIELILSQLLDVHLTLAINLFSAFGKVILCILNKIWYLSISSISFEFNLALEPLILSLLQDSVTYAILSKISTGSYSSIVDQCRISFVFADLISCSNSTSCIMPLDGSVFKATSFQGDSPASDINCLEAFPKLVTFFSSLSNLTSPDSSKLDRISNASLSSGLLSIRSSIFYYYTKMIFLVL